LEEHILQTGFDGSSPYGNDPYISTTKDLNIARTRFNTGSGIIAIDLNKVKSKHYFAADKLRHTKSDDPYEITAYGIALYDQEVTIEYYVNMDAIVGFVQ